MVYYLYYLCLALSCMIAVTEADLCTVKDDGQCYYTVECNTPGGISTIPSCEYSDPYITLIINQSTIHNATANFFNTKFDSHIKIILAVNNDWNVVQNFAFSNFKNVLYMDLSKNNIKSLGNAFRGLKAMDSLNLSSNYLEVINHETFMLSDNKNRLSLLDLSNNLLSHLSEDLFVNIDNLKLLFLQENKLTTLGDQHFSNLKMLNYLNLGRNNLAIFDVTLKNLAYLIELDLSFNHLKEIKISEALSLETINLSHNEFEELTFEDFQPFPHLRMLDLSYNKLNNVSAINSEMMIKKKRRMLLYLNHNNISDVDSSFFLVFPYIYHLNLSYNQITEFKPGTFKHVKVLKVLIVSNCQLTLTPDSCEGLGSTLMIDIRSNYIVTLDATVFRECTKLRDIVADDNRIEAVDVKMFSELVPSLNKISLEGNPVEGLSFKIRVAVNIAIDIIIKISNVLTIMLMPVVLTLVIMYTSVHHRVILVYILKFLRFLLCRRFLK